jgi:hypothetical protein
MPVNLRNLLMGSILVFTLTGCGVIEVAETPESWGARAGSYGAEEWVKKEGKGIFPTSDSVAMYCVSISESGQKDFNWTFQQQIQSTDACTEAFVDGLK